MAKTIYDFSGYKEYLRHRSGAKGTRNGTKSALAKVMNCQTTYVSQVLHGDAQLSLEQAEKVNDYFGHTKDEGHFFLLLVQRDRAGTPSLKKYFKELIEEISARRMIITERLGKKMALDKLDQSVYYSSWIYGAVHMAITIPKLQSREAIADYLHLPIKKVTEVLDFLISIGLARTEKGNYLPSDFDLRLGNDSYNIIKHHTNWRNAAVESLDREQITDLHYSAVASLARQDIPRVKDAFLEALKNVHKTIGESKEEELCVINMDFFSLKR